MIKRKLIFAFVAMTLAGAAAWAQPSGMRGGGGAPGMNPAVAKLFGNNKAFSTKATMTMNNGDQPMSMDMNLFMMDGKMRSEMDMTKNKGIPAATSERMKQMGMDQIVTIARPDKKVSLMIFPSMQAYSETAFDEAQAKAAASDYKIEKQSMGKETFDGHPCEKNKVTITDDKGEKHEALVWNAVDLKDFPLQMEMNEDGKAIKMHFTNIKLEKPDAKVFEAPEGFTKYGSQMELMGAEMRKRAAAGVASKRP